MPSELIVETPLEEILNDIRDYYGLNRQALSPQTPISIPANEKTFPISNYQVGRLLALSPLGKVALKVDNLSDNNSVYITWISYDSSLVDAITATYWILSDETVNDILNGDSDYPCSTVRIAKRLSGENYVFLNKTSLSFKLGGGGGDPTGSSGAVVEKPHS